MVLNWDQVSQRLEEAMGILNNSDKTPVKGPFHVGIDLGTADVVLMVLDPTGKPIAAFLEWSEVVRDGVVVDFVGAVDIVRRLIQSAQNKLDVEFTSASTSFPPGTDQRLSTNIIETAGLDVANVQDEPSCVARLLKLDQTAVVDIGGGTTGSAVVQNGEVVFSDDEASGGKHITLSIAGHFKVSLEEAERRKFSPEEYNILAIARPTLQRISDIVVKQISDYPVEQIILTGGTCCLPGMDQVLAKEIGIPTKLPSQPLLFTPYSIASLNL